MDGAISDADKAIAKAKELLEKKTLTKADRTELLELLQSVQSAVKSEAPFIYKRFNEQMEKTSAEVKGELEAKQLKWITELAAMGLASGATPIELPDIQNNN